MAPGSDNPNIDDIAAKEQALKDQIANLKDFVEHGPDRAREALELERAAEEERLRTIPAPTEVQDRIREQEFMDKLSRGELKNEMRNQTKNGVLLVLLALAIIAIGAWIYSSVAG
ncbi:MAG: hypothetical protein ACPG32_10865 [Akkermansiaceae bacterium]